MNYIIIKGKVTGKWLNGASGTKRGLNIALVDGLVSFKAMFWREQAEKVDNEISVGDEIYLRAQVSDYWKGKNNSIAGIEVSDAEILSVKHWDTVKSDLIRRMSADIETSDHEKQLG